MKPRAKATGNDGRLLLTELAGALGVSTRQVIRWAKDGCPCERVRRARGGQPEYRFDLMAVKSWLIGHGASSKTKAHAAELPTPGAPAVPKNGALLELGEPGEPGYAGMLGRLHRAELLCFGSWARAITDGEIVIAAAMAESWQKFTEQLRKVEKDQAGIRKDDADWVEREEAEREVLRMALEIRTHLLALPKALAGRIAKRSAPECEKILQDEIDALLKNMAKGKGKA